MQVKRSSALPKNGESLSTSELVALAQAGNFEAFDPLYRRYGRRVLTYAIKVCGGDHAEADDVASAVWARAIECIDQWKPRGRDDDDLVRWLFGMVRVQHRRALRERHEQLPGGLYGSWSDGALLSAQECAAADDWVECPDKPELTARLHAEIDRLSPVSRNVVRLRLAGVDCAEIAQVTGLSRKQINDAWRRAQVQLRSRLAGRLDVDSMSEAERSKLRELAQELPPMSREVALLRLARLSIPEIAEATDMTNNQAHNAWRHAQDLLRKLMDDPSRARRSQVGRTASWQRERDRLAASVDLLTPAKRPVAQLRLAGLTYREIAERLGRPVGSMGSAWREALDQFTRLGLLPAA